MQNFQGKMWNFKDNLSSEDIISWHTSRPEEGFYTLNPPINFCIVQWQQILLPKVM